MILLERLVLYDDGEVMGRWRAPTGITLSTTPADVPMRLYRYEPDFEGRLVARELGKSDSTPETRQLEPGSYLLTFLATEETPEVRYPFLLKPTSESANPIPIHVDLPAKSDVPDGFLYVPAGLFVYGFGSRANEEGFRVWYKAMPAHARKTEAYLIARYETSYSEWLDFLRALPADERKKRLPKAVAQGHHVEVVAVGNDFELRMQPGGSELRANTNEPIRYKDRDIRSEQNWLRFPVTGISGEDALAYVSWLDSSGLVKNARICREDEWERAARGADGRMFPHGDRLRRDEANLDATYYRKSFGPDEVGSYPSSDSPFGLSDMAGNAYEMTMSTMDDSAIVARGGSYFFSERDATVVNRAELGIGPRIPFVGLRVCASIEGDQ